VHDGFILTHAYERVDMPTQEQVDAYLPPYEPRQVLDPAEPVSIGAMVGPEAFMEVRFLAHVKQQQALDLIPAWASEFKRIFGRASGGLTHTYHLDDAETVIVALGSVLGTVKDTVDEMREQGVKIGVLGITSFRPWRQRQCARRSPARSACWCSRRASPWARRHRLQQRLRFLPRLGDDVYTVIAGLGGRSITRGSRTACSRRPSRATRARHLPRPRPLAGRARAGARARAPPLGPIAEGILRDLGVVAAKIG